MKARAPDIVRLRDSIPTTTMLQLPHFDVQDVIGRVVPSSQPMLHTHGQADGCGDKESLGPAAVPTLQTHSSIPCTPVHTSTSAVKPIIFTRHHPPCPSSDCATKEMRSQDPRQTDDRAHHTRRRFDQNAVVGPESKRRSHHDIGTSQAIIHLDAPALPLCKGPSPNSTFCDGRQSLIY